MAVWMLPLGAALLGTVAYDALSTTLVTTSAAGPLTSRVARWAWALAGRTARPGSALMRMTGPLVLVLTVCVWLLLLWGGWTLIFSASPQAVLSSPGGEVADGWSRVYFTGFTVFTLGVGDFAPNGATWQVLTSVAVVSGLALTTLAITYLVPVVTAVTARRTQARTIAALGSTPQDIVVAAWRNGSFSYLDQQLPRLAEQILLTAARHLSYPVLHYFHSATPETDLGVQLHALDEAVTILDVGVPEPSRPHPLALATFRQATTNLLDNLSLEVAPTRSTAPVDLGPLRAAGIPTVDDATFAARLDRVAEHRRRLTAFAEESPWYRRPAE